MDSNELAAFAATTEKTERKKKDDFNEDSTLQRLFLPNILSFNFI